VIDIGGGAQSTRITGSYFGYLSNGNIVGPQPAIWVQDKGNNTLIGVDYATSSNALSFVQRNVFSWAGSGGAAISLQSPASDTTISGNWFGYSSTGTAASLAAPSDSYAIKDEYGATNISIGTNEDGSADSVESNWFGCITGGGIVLSAGGISSISGNFFGFNDANSNTPGTAQLPSCTPSSSYWVFMDGDATLGIRFQCLAIWICCLQLKKKKALLRCLTLSE